MAYRWLPLHMLLRAGVDTKADPRALSPPRHAKVENAQFEEVGGVQKRPGLASLPLGKVGGGFIAAGRGRAVAARGLELCYAAEGRMWSFSDKAQLWADRGRFESVLVKQMHVAHDRKTQIALDRAEVGNVIGYVWTEGVTGDLMYQFYDKKTRTVMGGRRLNGAERGQIRAVDGFLHVYYRATPINSMSVDVVDPADVPGTIGTPVIIGPGADALGEFDVDVQGVNSFVAYRSTGNLCKVVGLDRSGAAAVALVAIARACTKGIAISRYSTGKTSLARLYQDGGGDHVRHDWLKTDLTDDGAVDAVVANEPPATVVNITCLARAGQNAYVCWDLLVVTSAINTPQVKRATVDAAGVVAVKTLVRQSRLASRLVRWTDVTAERAMVHVLHVRPLQPQYVLIDADYVVGAVNGVRIDGEEVGLLARILPQGGVNIYTIAGHLPQIEPISATQFGFAAEAQKRLVTPVGVTYRERGFKDVVYTLSDSRAYRGVEQGAVLYLPGGYLAQYDGVRVTEASFLAFPEEWTGLVIVWAGPGAPLPAGEQLSGQYMYAATWEKMNAAGEVTESTFAGAQLATVGAAGTNAVRLICPTLPYTNDDNIFLVWYRTKHGEPGGPLYRISSRNPGLPAGVNIDGGCPKNNPNGDTITFEDARRSNTDGAPAFYLNPSTEGTALENISPPPPPAIAGGQWRIFALDPEDTHLIRFSKQRLEGDQVAFQDTQTIVLPQDGGDATALDVSEGGLYAFQERAALYVLGQGPDNVGRNAYPPPNPIAEVGCIDPRSVARTLRGTFFQSMKGIYAINLGNQAEYVGAQVEDYVLGQTITGAVHVPDKHQVHFLTAAGGMLVYDELIGEWSVRPGRSGISATLWQGKPVHLEVTSPYQPATALWADALVTGYQLALELGWVKAPDPAADIQGFARCREILLLGEWRSTHKVKVSVQFDYKDPAIYGWAETFIWDPVDEQGVAIVTPGKVMQMRCLLRNQKFQAIKVRIEDYAVVLTDLRESFKLTALSFLVGFDEMALKRLGAAQTK